MKIRKAETRIFVGSLLILAALAACESLIYRQPGFGGSDVVRHAFQHPDGNYRQWLDLRTRIDPGTATIGEVRVYYSTDPARDPATFPSLVATWNPATESASACLDFALIGILPNGSAPPLIRHYWKAEYSAGGASDVLHQAVRTVPFDRFETSLAPCS